MCFNKCPITFSGMIDFVPDVIDEGGIFHPAKYTYFTTLLQKSTNWITQSAVSVTFQAHTCPYKSLWNNNVECLTH